MRPHVTVDPAVNFGQPSIRGINLEILTGMVWAGDAVDFIADEYELSRAQVLVGCWFQIMHGRFTRSRDQVAWKVAWVPWLDENAERFWRSEHDEIPDPPTRGAAV